MINGLKECKHLAITDRLQEVKPEISANMIVVWEEVSDGRS
jgi:hypothetical protein